MKKQAVPKVTIAMVVRNAAETFKSTFHSIKEQTYLNKEIIIVDGNSTDSTCSLIKQNAAEIDRWVSERDDGVYHAMNKAARMSSGEYIIYMNAGDIFFSVRSLEEAMRFEDSNPDLIICPYLYTHEGASTLIKPIETSERISHLSNGNIKNAMQNFVCHQATVTRLQYLLEKGGYDTSFSLIADQDMILKAHEDKKAVYYSPAIMCVFRGGGLSSNVKESSKQFKRLLASYAKKKQLAKHFDPERHQYSFFQVLKEKLPWVGRLYSQRKALRNEVSSLISELEATKNLPVTSLSSNGISSLAEIVFQAGEHSDKISLTQDKFWDLGRSASIRKKEREPLPRTHFVAFASGNDLLLNSLERIGKEAADLEIFQSIVLHTTESLLSKYPSFETYLDFIRSTPKGYGCWIWKIFMVLHHLQEMPDGDILFYTDAGCEISRYGLPVFEEMLFSSWRNEHLFFQMHQHKEYCWTKREVLDFFEEKYSFVVPNTGQVAATTFFLKKTKKNVELCKEWLQLSTYNLNEFIDDKIRSRQMPLFREHRHDQSLLSCLLKFHDYRNILDSDLHCAFRAPRSWHDDMLMLEYPIYWSHRKSDMNAKSDINIQVELFRILSYAYLSDCNKSGRDLQRISFLRDRLKSIYHELQVDRDLGS
jgi:glycosyltransferase involved in cell wall biosynthesis